MLSPLPACLVRTQAEAIRLRQKRGALDAAATLRAVQADILAISERAPRAATGWVPPKQRPLVKPCPLCGREQPAFQTRDSIREYALREPTSVLYTRADGTVRAHAVGCDLLPHAPVKLDHLAEPLDRAARQLVCHANTGLRGASRETAPAVKFMFPGERRDALYFKRRAIETRAAIARWRTARIEEETANGGIYCWND